MLAIIVFVVVVVFLGHLTFNYRPGKPFSHKELRVFDKYDSYRDELESLKKRVAPPAPKPDYNLTLGFNQPKPAATETKE